MQVIYFVWCTAIGLLLTVAGFVIGMATMELFDKCLFDSKIFKVVLSL